MDKTITLSEQQENVRQWVLTGKGSLNLVARAGCGKTSTLLAIAPALDGETFIGAYNKAIAKEISEKLSALGLPQRKCFASTMHGAGYIAWRRKAPKCVIDNKKVQKICDAIAMPSGHLYPPLEPTDKAEALNYFGEAVIKAVSLAKQRAFGVLSPIEDRSKWYDLIDHFGLEEDLPQDINGGNDAEPKFNLDDFIDLCMSIYRTSLDRCQEVIDFDDMILAPLYFRVFFYPKDWVLIDEAQDTNPARRALALKMLKPKTGRLIAVGDPAQAIYGFTGADADSMDLIQQQLNSSTLPLNKTFRCPKAVVRLAQTWVPDIEAAESNPEGVVRSIKLTPDQEAKEPGFWDETTKASDVILCRNTAPIIELAYKFLRLGIACRVEGREIGQGLIKLINRWKAKNLTALMPKVEQYRDREIQKYLAKGKEERAAAIEDQCETILVLAGKLMGEGKGLVADLVAFIDGMFSDTPEGQPQQMLTLSTVHKAKGREWSRVYLLGRNKYMPSKYARKDWQVEQENNLCYVAVTRAKEELVEVIV